MKNLPTRQYGLSKTEVFKRKITPKENIRTPMHLTQFAQTAAYKKKTKQNNKDDFFNSFTTLFTNLSEKLVNPPNIKPQTSNQETNLAMPEEKDNFDPDYNFAMMLYSYLIQLPENIKEDLRLQIMKIVYKK